MERKARRRERRLERMRTPIPRVRMRRGWMLALLALLAAALFPPAASAQYRRGPRILIRKGLLEKPDTLARGDNALARIADSLLHDAARRLTVDSLGRIVAPPGYTAALDSAGRLLCLPDSLVPDSPGLRPLTEPEYGEVDTLGGPDAGTTERNRGIAALDSLGRLCRVADTLALDSLGLRPLARTAEKFPAVAADSSATLPVEASPIWRDTTRKRQGSWLMGDSMSLSKVCWISTVLPGYGQIYNKQYWKLPILYGTIGAGLTLFIHENRNYRPIKRLYDELTLTNTDRDAAVDVIQAKMIRSNTRRQIYLGATLASYIYFLGDAAVNYSTNDVSDVKKATTLACICPGAGQIYNKSYWKVPFVVGGFASLIYCIDWNNRGYQRFQRAYSLRSAYDANPEAYPGGSPDEFSGRIAANTLKSYKDSYRRNRDLCIIITAGLYILQIVDAHVDAHLKDYDISDDLSMNLEPLIDYPYVPMEGGNRPVFGFNMSFNF